jgi:uncharacterized protein (TIGR03083 family)
MQPPIDTLPLFPLLNQQLISFLKSLKAEDWNKQTVARQWKIKDVVAHLLDGNFRQLSVHRDHWTVEPDMEVNSFQTLVDYLNKFNADWVKAAKRLSPRVLIEMLEITNHQVYEVFASRDPFANAIYSVSWAGEEVSKNWFDIAREFTERWMHQQQIRDAMGDKGIMTKELYYPVLNIFMQAWPYTASSHKATEGTQLRTAITGVDGGIWNLVKTNDQWKLSSTVSETITSETTIDGNVAWKLFTKSIRKDSIKDNYTIKGDEALGNIVLDMVSVMA